MSWSHFDAVVRRHLADAAQWRNMRQLVPADRAIRWWVGFRAVCNAEELAAWGPVGPRGVG